LYLQGSFVLGIRVSVSVLFGHLLIKNRSGPSRLVSMSSKHPKGVPSVARVLETLLARRSQSDATYSIFRTA
jgi:hypothetical protein